MSPARRTLELEQPLDVVGTVRSTHLIGAPSSRIDGNEIWRATRTPEGPGTLRLGLSDHQIEAEAWGPGADWLLRGVPDLIGLSDHSAASFSPQQEPLRSLWRRHRSLRIPKTRMVLEALVPAILAQKVQSKEAKQSFRRLIHAYAEPAPGPEGQQPLPLPLSPQQLLEHGYEDFHPFGIERRRAECLRTAARYAKRLEEAADMSFADAHKRLTAIRGIGPWTASKVLFWILGDPDAVALGDYNLPSFVSFRLAGEERADDERMLELLEPYRGHRGRVIQLLHQSGKHAPRRAPRRALRRIERH